MAADSLGSARHASPLRAFLLSLICPGLGQIWCGRISAALAVVFLRVAALAVPAACVYGSNARVIPCVAGGLAVFIGAHILSCADSWRYGSAEGRLTAARWLFLFAAAGYALSFVSLFLFFSLFPVKKLNDTMLYPSFFKGEYILCSALASGNLKPGELVLYRLNGSVVSGRIASIEEGDCVELAGGVMSINGDMMEQAPASEVSLSGNEHFYREKGPDGWYTIYRYPASKKDPERVKITAEKGTVIIVPDNRIEGKASAVSLSSIGCRIESVIPLSWGRALPGIGGGR
jgi:hypothetical protein